MVWLHLTCHHYFPPTNLGGLYDLRVKISWRHLVIAWKVLASVVLCMPPLLSGIRSPSLSSGPSPLTFSRAIWRHICLISHIHDCDVTFLSYCVFSPSFCLVSIWYHKRFWARRLVTVEIGAIENWHYYHLLLFMVAHSLSAWISYYISKKKFNSYFICNIQHVMWHFGNSFSWFVRLCNALPRVHGPGFLIYFPRDCLTKITYAKPNRLGRYFQELGIWCKES